jgi:hypothetical protein
MSEREIVTILVVLVVRQDYHIDKRFLSYSTASDRVVIIHLYDIELHLGQTWTGATRSIGYTVNLVVQPADIVLLKIFWLKRR